jgi:hypothetical protein
VDNRKSSFYRMTIFALLGLLILPLASIAQEEVLHPSQLPALSVDAKFPRCSPEELLTSGFPDNMHAQWWPDWEVLVDAEGNTYGPLSICKHKVLTPREGLVIEPGRHSYGLFVTEHHEAFKPCDIMTLLENLTWAGTVLPEMLGLVPTDTLTVISPDNIPQYQELTGYGVWRLYQLEGNTCIIEPYGTLQARTLDAHAVFMLVTDWILTEKLPVKLPAWMHTGLVEYMSDDGAHLISYMRQFRSRDPFLFTPEMTNFILSQPPDPDIDRDREMFRRASYASFLMVWELVENRGGLEAMREFLVLVGEGVDIDKASKKVYGMKMLELEKSLDPAVHGEPIDKNTTSLKPARQP